LPIFQESLNILRLEILKARCVPGCSVVSISCAWTLVLLITKISRPTSRGQALPCLPNTPNIAYTVSDWETVFFLFEKVNHIHRKMYTGSKGTIFARPRPRSGSFFVTRRGSILGAHGSVLGGNVAQYLRRRVVLNLEARWLCFRRRGVLF
jgi:hypothetical protein